MQTLTTLWRWLTTTRYTRTLEEEVERLRAENRALLNSLLGTAGFPPIETPPAAAGKAARLGGPIPRLRRRSWHQIAAWREREAAPRPQNDSAAPPGGPFH